MEVDVFMQLIDYPYKDTKKYFTSTIFSSASLYRTHVNNVYLCTIRRIKRHNHRIFAQWNREGLMSDKWKMHRLASTGKLVSIRKTGN